MNQRLEILQKGTGSFVGSHCDLKPSGTEVLDCTNVVTIVLGETFRQQGRGADWKKVSKKIDKNTKSRGKGATIEGEDIQAALQSELGWKGIFSSPIQPTRYPKKNSSEAASRGTKPMGLRTCKEGRVQRAS